MTEPEETPTPILFEHCKTVYAKMLERSKPAKDYDLNTTVDARVFEGYTTRLFSALGLSTPHYTTVLSTLKGMECLEQVRRGGGNAKSRWILWKPPEEEDFRNYEARKAPGRGKVRVLEQGLVEVNRRLTRVESALGLDK